MKGEVPLPLWAVSIGAALALGLSFVGLSILWTEPRLQSPSGTIGTAVPRSVSRALTALEWPVRTLGLVAFLTVWAAALIGPFNADQNLAPYAIYIGLWTGGMILSGLVGNFWGIISPFETVGRLFRGPSNERLEGSLGLWPAAGLLAMFGWLELAHPTPADPRTLGIAIAGYVGLMVLGSTWWGLAWIRSAEAFGAFFRLVAGMAPFYRDEVGQLRVRPPFVGLGGLAPVPGTAAMVIVALGATTFDGLTRSSLWGGIVANRTGWALAAYATLGLVATTVFFGGLWIVAMKRAARITGRPWTLLAEAFAHSLIPIALGYVIAHYFSFVVFEGQRLVALTSDPFGLGWDLFGTAEQVVNYEAVSPVVVGVVQTAAIVMGHLAGVVLSHDRAVAMFSPPIAVRSQRALLDVMVVYTVVGLLLLLGE